MLPISQSAMMQGSPSSARGSAEIASPEARSRVPYMLAALGDKVAVQLLEQTAALPYALPCFKEELSTSVRPRRVAITTQDLYTWLHAPGNADALAAARTHCERNAASKTPAEE
jgi:hypothetical protein